MTEAKYKADVTKKLRKLGLDVQRIEDKISHGCPDMIVSGNNLTSWWEVKKDFISGKRVQLEVVKGIRRATRYCYYVVFTEDDFFVLDPLHVACIGVRPSDANVKIVASSYDPMHLVQYICDLHMGKTNG